MKTMNLNLSKQLIRSLNYRKLLYKNGHDMAYFNANQLAKILIINKAHAYRIIKDPGLLTAQHRLIIDTIKFNQLPGFRVGYKYEDGHITDHTGFKFTQRDLENLKWLKSSSLLNRMLNDIKINN
jgi:hypothetical protein